MPTFEIDVEVEVDEESNGVGEGVALSGTRKERDGDAVASLDRATRVPMGVEEVGVYVGCIGETVKLESLQPSKIPQRTNAKRISLIL